MSAAQHTPQLVEDDYELTGEEAFRYAFHEGYLHALNEIGRAFDTLGYSSDHLCVVLHKLRTASAVVNAKHAVAKASGRTA